MKVALAMEMKEHIAIISSENDKLVRLAMRMAEEGYEDPGCSDEDLPEQLLAAADGGISQLLNFENGQVSVCTGKACTRKGGSEHILSALVSRWEDDPKVDVQQCSCMGECKKAANVELRGDGTTTVVTGLQPEMLPAKQAAERELDLVC